MSPGWATRALLLLLAVNAAVFAVFTLPRLVQERSLSARAAVVGQEISRERARLEAARERAETIRRNGEDERRFLAEVVGDRRTALVPLLAEVVGLAEGLGLQPRSQSYRRSGVPGAGITRFEIQMPVNGTYPQLAAFVKALERSKRFVTVEKISMAQRDEGEASLELVLSTYFKLEPGDEAR